MDIAVNHDPDAILMHCANHPGTRHYCEDVWTVDPKEACGNNPVAMIWFSPDCTHFSRAKGATPVSKKIRGLAWVGVKWAYEVRPRVLMMENVPEIQTWGPLIPKVDPKTGRLLKIVGYGNLKKSKHGAPRVAVSAPGEVVPQDQRFMIPDPERKGETFDGFIKALSTGIDRGHPAFEDMCETLGVSEDSELAKACAKGLGYTVEYKQQKSCDFGAPTSRTRFYMIGRCDGLPIVWPKPTHGPKNSKAVKAGKLLPYRTAAECIDWSIPAVSIFEREKPLAENTLRRIARGIQKFVIENPEPFIVAVNHGGDGFRGQSIHDPLQTVTSKHGYGIVTPTIMCNNSGNAGASADEPLPTITTGNRNFLVSPIVTAIGQTSAKGRSRSTDEPLSTIVGKAEHLLIAPHLTKFQQNSSGQKLDEPIDTVMAGAQRFGLIAPTLIQYHSETADGEVRGQSLDEPLMVQDTSNRYALSVAHIMKNYAGGYKGSGSAADEPVGTITAKDHNSLVTAHLLTLRNRQYGQRVDEPITTIACSGAHHAEVQAFLMKYYGTGTAKPANEPIDTITAKDRFALVTIHGEEYIITDIKMRMLQPRELFNCQGFRRDYIISPPTKDGKPYAKSKQVQKVGNSVTPPVAAAMVQANLPEHCKGREESFNG